MTSNLSDLGTRTLPLLQPGMQDLRLVLDAGGALQAAGAGCAGDQRGPWAASRASSSVGVAGAGRGTLGSGALGCPSAGKEASRLEACCSLLLAMQGALKRLQTYQVSRQAKAQDLPEDLDDRGWCGWRNHE